ncbi:hypothetical protein PHAVU_009G222201 [Phaseolus vulgaris]|uniref:acetolactate synthase, chloroplastic-like n=1 Tax=Phaseolus vulgaris TaxID=3885 RepID=UPI0035CB3A55
MLPYPSSNNSIPISPFIKNLNCVLRRNPIIKRLIAQRKLFFLHINLFSPSSKIKLNLHPISSKILLIPCNAKMIVYIDIDSAELGKIKQPHVSVCGDLKLALQGINRILEDMEVKGKLDLGAWREEINVQKEKFPLSYKTFDDEISPQYAIEVLDELTNGDAIITAGVGQHQMWAAQFYKYKRPRQWLTSGGFGAMGFGLPAAMGAAVANPGAVVVDIDGDGSFIMNVQELAL